MRTMGLELHSLEPDGWKTPSFTSRKQSGSCRSRPTSAAASAASQPRGLKCGCIGAVGAGGEADRAPGAGHSGMLVPRTPTLAAIRGRRDRTASTRSRHTKTEGKPGREASSKPCPVPVTKAPANGSNGLHDDALFRKVRDPPTGSPIRDSGRRFPVYIVRRDSWYAPQRAPDARGATFPWIWQFQLTGWCVAKICGSSSGLTSLHSVVRKFCPSRAGA